MAERSYYLRTYPVRHVKDVGAPPDQPTKRRRTSPNAERYARVMELADGTRTVEEIAAEIGITAANVHAAFNRLRERGCNPQSKKMIVDREATTRIRNTEILQMIEDGCKQAEVAKRFGISQSRISEIKLRVEKKPR